MTEQQPLLRTAELAYRLAHAVRIFCSDKGHPPFSYPSVYTYGQHTVDHSEFELSADQEDFASSALLHCATYLMAVQLDTALDTAVGTKRFQHRDVSIQAASCIVRSIRNAFAHDPFNPVWDIRQPDCQDRVFEIADVIRLDTTGLSGKKVAWQHYGGPLALFRLSQHIRSKLLNVGGT